MRKPERKRVRKWPTIDEFWTSDEPKMFRLMAADHADWRKFRRWILKHLKTIENSDFDYDAECMKLHGETIRNEICLGDFDRKGIINTDMAIFKWNNQMFMSQDEIKKLTDVQREIK